MLNWSDALMQHRKQYVWRALVASKGNVSAAARVAGVDRCTFHRWMQEHGFTRENVQACREGRAVVMSTAFEGSAPA